MKTVIHYPAPGWVTRMAAPVLVALWVGVMWLMRRGDVQAWPGMVGPAWVFVISALWLGPPLTVASGGALAVVWGLTRPQFVPLAVADARPGRGGQRLTWPEGRRRRGALLPAAPALDPLLSEACQAARQAAAQGLPLPRTSREAADAIALGTGAGSGATELLVGMTALLGLSIWLNQPLILLGYVAFPGLLQTGKWTHRFLLAADGLWVAIPGRAAARIALPDIVSVSRRGFLTIVVQTRHPAFPELRIHCTYSADLIRRLKAGL